MSNTQTIDARVENRKDLDARQARINAHLAHLSDQCSKQHYFNAMHCVARLIEDMMRDFRDALNPDSPRHSPIPGTTPPPAAEAGKGQPSQGQGGEGRVRWFRWKDGKRPSDVWKVDGNTVLFNISNYGEPANMVTSAATLRTIVNDKRLEEFFPDSPPSHKEDQPPAEAQVVNVESIERAWKMQTCICGHGRCEHQDGTGECDESLCPCRKFSLTPSPQPPAGGHGDIGPVSDEQGLRNIANDRNMKIPDWVRQHLTQCADLIARIRKENQTLREQLRTLELWQSGARNVVNGTYKTEQLRQENIRDYFQYPNP